MPSDDGARSPAPNPTSTQTRPAITPAAGFFIVLGAATLFGMLGPLSRFAYDAGMEPAAFVAWRALIGGRRHRSPSSPGGSRAARFASSTSATSPRRAQADAVRGAA